MIQSRGEEWRGIGRNSELIRVTVCGQCSSSGKKQSWKRNRWKETFILHTGKGLSEIRAFSHGPEGTTTLAAGSDLPVGFYRQICGPGAPVSLSLGSLVLIVIPRWTGSAGGYPGRSSAACAVVALSSSLILLWGAELLLLLPGILAGAVSPSNSSMTFTRVIYQIWLVQSVGKSSLGLYEPDFLSMQ